MTGWQEQAGCRHLSPNMFLQRDASTNEGKRRRTRALSVCSHCPVQAECLEDALADPNGAYGRIAGGLTQLHRAHIAAVRERARSRLTKPLVASAYRGLWDGTVAEMEGPAGWDASRHVRHDQEAARALGRSRVASEVAVAVGPELRAAVAEGDQDAVDQIMRGLPTEHRAALLVAFAGLLGVA